MAKKLFNKYPIIDYIAITIGAAIMAIAIGVFLVDAKVVPGGVSGLSMAVHYLSNNSIPVGLMIWLFNVPLYIWGLKELGKSFGVRTFYGFTINSFFIDFFRGDIPGFSYVRLQDTATIQDLFKNDFLFLILIGAVLLGIGLGLIFKFKGTTAGSDIVAAILQKKFGIKPGMAIMFVDFFVIALAGLIIDVKDLSPDRPAFSLTLYAFFLLFVSAKLVDVIIDGFDYARAAYIISDKYEEITNAIMNNLSRGATALKSRGIYKNVEREVIFTVIPLKEVGTLTELVKEIDPSAFVIINNVHEVLGEGFRRRI
ncbi:MAG: membrane protein [Ignavibacteriae bacterium]|nr:membrane protein [Ignavibacteriota bacterium]|tara:strand:+ start:21 stop:956 length:936 start_codon:yes stop_codon:yes gene_type:complete